MDAIQFASCETRKIIFYFFLTKENGFTAARLIIACLPSLAEQGRACGFVGDLLHGALCVTGLLRGLPGSRLRVCTSGVKTEDDQCGKTNRREQTDGEGICVCMMI